MERYRKRDILETDGKRQKGTDRGEQIEGRDREEKRRGTDRGEETGGET